MIESHEREIKHRGYPATLTVMRNDGYVWGRIRFPNPILGPLDVTTRKDHYWAQDEDALDAFERASRNPKCVEPAHGWL